MQESDLPSFSHVIGTLGVIIFSCGVFLVALAAVDRFGPRNIPTLIWVLLAILLLLVLGHILWLVRELFPNWLRVGRSAVVLKEVMEIEGKV